MGQGERSKVKADDHRSDNLFLATINDENRDTDLGLLLTKRYQVPSLRLIRQPRIHFCTRGSRGLLEPSQSRGAPG